MEVFWIDFENPPIGLGLGAGVTGRSREDALSLVRDRFGDLPIAKVGKVDTLDQLEENHVRPNMGNFLKRGIWFPLQGLGW